ncbi:hypothetical protein H6784_05130 [Candidatus Nomurabacteria bacterium]|nr:hypothetical protein [Candidatus Nomurabacteria bacterium]
MYLGQVEAILKFFKSLLPIGSNRLLHIGTMMSYKTLNEIDCVWLEAFAPKERLAEIYSLKET